LHHNARVVGVCCGALSRGRRRPSLALQRSGNPGWSGPSGAIPRETSGGTRVGLWCSPLAGGEVPKGFDLWRGAGKTAHVWLQGDGGTIPAPASAAQVRREPGRLHDAAATRAHRRQHGPGEPRWCARATMRPSSVASSTCHPCPSRSPHTASGDARVTRASSAGTPDRWPTCALLPSAAKRHRFCTCRW